MRAAGSRGQALCPSELLGRCTTHHQQVLFGRKPPWVGKGNRKPSPLAPPAPGREWRWGAQSTAPCAAPSVPGPVSGPQDVLFCSWSSDLGRGRSLGHEVLFPQNQGHCHLQSLTFPLKAGNCQAFWEPWGGQLCLLRGRLPKRAEPGGRAARAWSLNKESEWG